MRHLRWQLVLALLGVAAIAALVVVVSSRSFVVQPAAGGELIEGAVGPPATVNPLFAATDIERDLAALLFSGLTRIDANGLVQPDLATWELSPDGRSYTFTLRPGITWHDGEPVTADDVVLTARLAADDRVPAQKSALAAPWRAAEVTKLDSRTVRITLPEPFAPFLAATALGLLPAHLLADVPAAELPRHRFSTLEPIGTGGFRLLQPGGLDAAGARLARFDPYWAATGRALPYLDQLSFRFYPTRSAAREALGQRQVHSLGRVPPASIATLGAETGFYNALEAGYTLVYLNPDNVLFADPAVRQALSLAVDRVGLTQDPDLMNGQAVPAVSPIPPGSWAYAADVRPAAYDPVQARRILEQAGWIDSDGDGIRDRDGKPLAFELAVSNDALFQGLGERLLADWAAIGVEATVTPLDQQEMVTRLRGRSHAALLSSVSLGGNDPDPFPLWHSSQIQNGQNFAGFNQPEADRLLAEARLPGASYPEEVARRKQLYGEFQALFAREQPAVMLFHPVYAYGVADPNVGGVQLPQLLLSSADRFATLPNWYLHTERVFGGGRGERPTP